MLYRALPMYSVEAVATVNGPFPAEIESEARVSIIYICVYIYTQSFIQFCRNFLSILG